MNIVSVHAGDTWSMFMVYRLKLLTLISHDGNWPCARSAVWVKTMDIPYASPGYSSHLDNGLYHPIANDLVDHFHHQLKGAIKCHQILHWTKAFTFILLGIHTITIKQDCSVLHSHWTIVHGTTLWYLQGEFLCTTLVPSLAGARLYASQLKMLMQNILPSSIYQ